MRIRFQLTVLAAVLCLASSAQAATLTSAQLTTLKNNIAASADTVPSGVGGCEGFIGVAVNAIPNSSDGNACVAAMYNRPASPAFTIWKTSVPKFEVGQTFNTADLAGLSQLNTTRLQNLGDWLPMINPSNANVRQFFDDIFSGAGGANTRAALLILWKQLTTRVGKLYATGTGSDASPATLATDALGFYISTVTSTNVEAARSN